MKCNTKCIYFPKNLSEPLKEYIDDFGLKHMVRDYICDYDDHKITKFKECPNYRIEERIKI